MRKHYQFVCALLLSSLSVFSQPCTLTQADLLAAPAGSYTIPAGAVLCINSNFCMGAASNFPGSCSNSNINSLIINGTLRISDNVIFRFAGSMIGTGKIEILDRGRILLFGSINCAGGLQILAVDRTLPNGTNSNALVSCSSPSCEVTYTDGYKPFGVVTPGLGFTSTGCAINSYPSNSILLPVNLTNFSGNAEGKGVRLTWSTSSEQQNKGFEVERSSADDNWEQVGWVASKASDGNSNFALQYGFTDQNPGSASMLNYRLKQMDINGNFQYSSVLHIETLKAQEWRVRTEGSTIRVQVQSAKSENVVISVVGVSGNTLYKATHALNAGSYTIVIPAGTYAKGLHVVSLKRNGGELKREKILLR